MTMNINDQLRTFYKQKSLSAGSLERFVRLVDKPAEPGGNSVRMWQTLALAATVALAFLAGILFVARNPTSQTPVAVASTDISNKLAQEVARRHLKCAHVDFTETDLASLAKSMTNLDFDVATPDADISNLTLKGGHYCVINGQLALHATFIDANGETISLMETRTSPQFASLRHAMQQIDDIDVEMWQKDGVVLAIARSS